MVQHLDSSSVDARRVCDWCRVELGDGLRSDARYCSQRCRQAAHRFKPRGLVVASGSETLRLAYADPPYVGKSGYYRDHPDFGGEVDHQELITRLVSTYDGWALSCSSDSLPYLLRLCPPEARVAVWVKGSVPSRSLRPHNAYEPVIYCGGRAVQRSADDVLVHGVTARSTDPGWVIGAKPAAFCYWVFQLLGASRSDELVDVYPGSGGVARAWSLFVAS